MFSRNHATAKIGAEILPMEMDYLPEYFQKKAEIEINYIPKAQEERLQELRQLMDDDRAFKNVRIPEVMLLSILDSRKNDMNRAFKQAKKYVAFRKKNIDLFTNVKFEALQPLLRVFTPLPWRCQDGCTIIFIDMEKWSSKKHSVEHMRQMLVVLLTTCLLEPMTRVNGYKFIFDLNVRAEAIKLCTLHNIHLLYYGIQEVLPARCKEFHLINVGMIGRSAYQMIKVLLSEKFKNRVLMHASVDCLFKFFPKSVIPSKYGGDLKDYDMTDWMRRKTAMKELSPVHLL